MKTKRGPGGRGQWIPGTLVWFIVHCYFKSKICGCYSAGLAFLQAATNLVTVANLPSIPR
jgi:hypothetical protein